MPIGTAAALIISAIIAGATTVTSSVISSKDAEEAQNEGRRLGNMKRNDELGWQKTQARLGRAKLAFQKKEATELRKERGLDRGIAARDKQQANMMGLINSKEVLKSNFLNFFQRPVAGRRAA